MSADLFPSAEVMSMLIPIVAIIMGIGLVMFSIYVDFQRKREILNAVHRERMAAIEKGIELPPLPPEIFQSKGRGRGRNPTRTLERGLVLMFVGVAIGVALWRTGKEAAWWGLVPFGLGLAYVISSRFHAAEPQLPASGSSQTTDERFR